MPVIFKTNIYLLDYLPGMRYLEIPKDVVDSLGGKLSKRLLCTLNDSLSYQCGFVALGEGKAYISITQKRMQELGVVEGDEVTVSLEEDHSKYGTEMPGELEELLYQDPEGSARFENLTTGKQRYIIQYVAAVKNPDKRLERAVRLISNLKQLPGGKEQFRDILGLD